MHSSQVIVSATKGRRNIKMPLCVDPRAEHLYRKYSFCFISKILFLGKFGSKIQNCLKLSLVFKLI